VRFFIIIIFLLIPQYLFAKGYDVFGFGIYDVKFDGGQTEQTSDFRYEKRLDKVLIDIGPEEDNFFYLKPLIGLEFTGDSAFYLLSGIYIEDNLGELFSDRDSSLYFTPSFAVGYYDDGDGKKLGNSIEFRTTFEISYELENLDRIGISFGHISNANIGDKNPGVEIISLSYHVPF